MSEIKPYVGCPATIYYPSDRKPCVVVKISPSGKKVTLAEIDTDAIRKNRQPEGMHNGFPVWNYTCNEEELKTYTTSYVIQAYLRKNGWYYVSKCLPVGFGSARYRRDYSD